MKTCEFCWSLIDDSVFQGWGYFIEQGKTYYFHTECVEMQLEHAEVLNG